MATLVLFYVAPLELTHQTLIANLWLALHENMYRIQLAARLVSVTPVISIMGLVANSTWVRVKWNLRWYNC